VTLRSRKFSNHNALKEVAKARNLFFASSPKSQCAFLYRCFLAGVYGTFYVTTQVDRLKTIREKRIFEAMFGARIRHFRQSMAIVLF